MAEADETAPTAGEVPEIFYVTGHTVAEGLRALSERFEIDDDLVLIGLWNIEPPEREGYPEAYLQVVVTHLEPDQSGRGDDRCRVVIGEQRGEPVACGAVEAIHGDALGMVGGHAFQGAEIDRKEHSGG